MKNYKDSKVLKELYWRRGLSIVKISEHFGVDPSTIYYWLRKANIPRRSPTYLLQEKVVISRKILVELYQKRKLTAKEIARRFGLKSHKSVLLKLIKFGIPRRTKSEVSTKYPKAPFAGDLQEKAYLLGLRAGDLWSKRHRNLIQVETASPRAAQVQMMKEVFGKFTTVHVYPKKEVRGLTNRIYCLLDSSFEFLLRKRVLCPVGFLRTRKISLVS